MVKPVRSRSLVVALGVGLAAALLVEILWSAHALDLFENGLWDLRARTLARPAATTSQVDVIVLDQGSLDWADQDQGQTWPWPREYYAVLADFLSQAHAKALVFDVIYDQSSTFGGDDEKFAKALKRMGRAVLAEAVLHTDKGLIVNRPVEPLASSAAVLGHVGASQDSDGVNRRVQPFVQLSDGTWIPGLAVAAWELGTGKHMDPSPDPAILRYRGPQATHQRYSAREVINSAILLSQGQKPTLSPEVFRDHYVFFGFSAQGLLDLRPSPVDPKYPGVEVHATYLDNLLAGDVVHPLPWGWAAFLVLTVSLVAAVAVGKIRRAVALVPVFLLALAVPSAAGWLAYEASWWWPVVPPALAAVVAGVVMLLINYAGEGRQKRFIQNAFGQYLSPEVIKRLVADPGQLQLGGEKRCLSIFFSDVAGFTSISEKLDPIGLTSLLNDYLSEMTSIIYAYGGTIDKYEGDAIIAFWNAPLDLPDHALRAVRASLECQRRLAEIQPRLQKLSGRPVLARIGLNSGDVVIGNMGSSQRFNYTFLGDAGNLASRLEGINKLFGTMFLASEFTKALAGEAEDLYWREISRVRVVGKKLPVTVFEPLEKADAEARRSVLETFDRGLRAYYRGDFTDALAVFEAQADVDVPSARYADRVRELMTDPPSDWEGVWDAKEK